MAVKTVSLRLCMHSVNVRVAGSNATSLILTSGRPSISTGPTRNDEPNAVGA